MARLTEPASFEWLNIKQAVALGCLNSDSVLVRDSLHKQFLKLSAAFEVALVDAIKDSFWTIPTANKYLLVKR